MPNFDVPHFVANHLRYTLRPYQKAAIERFVQHWQSKNGQRQLLFQMATGSGKTLVMAALLLYLYEKGYRHFLFFVNSTAILNKTRDNFLNPASSKYLFRPPIQMQGRMVRIREVQNFENSVPDDLNVIFTTVQALHSRLQETRENALTEADFQDHQVVFLSDEAHHLNASTKNSNQNSWETSVQKIVEARPDHLLLEFTATIAWNNKNIREKYEKRLLFDYSLKQFRQEGYSKEVKLLQTKLPPFERALQAMLLSQYRKKVFAAQGIKLKPIVLFKSKTIRESEQFFGEFQEGLMRIGESNPVETQRIAFFPDIFDYLNQQGISLVDFILELKNDFSAANCLIVNSQNDSEAKQLTLNRLEEPNNPYRAIFAVDKLNEGWDVLNLFDIVRLYDTKINKKKPSKTTLAEAQLIGRGARYFPFRKAGMPRVYQRRYDDQPNHSLRIGEELFYHSAHNPDYLLQMGNVLQALGIQATEEEETLDRKGESKVKRQDLATYFQSKNKSKNAFYLKDFPLPIVRKAMQQLPFYQFDRLRHYFPTLRSTTELLSSPLYLADVPFDRDTSFELSSKAAQLEEVRQFLEEVAAYFGEQLKGVDIL